VADAEEKKNGQTKTDAENKEQVPAKKSGLLKYIIIAVGAIVLSAGGTYVALMFTGGKAEAPTEQTDQETHAQASKEDTTQHEADANDEGIPESLLVDEMDQGVLDMINENLAVLDWHPDDSELGLEESGMSVEDSLKEVNWLEKEKAEIEKRKKELDKREQELNKLNREVSKKMLIIDQAESSRVSKLAKLYDGMDARSVTRLMANLDDETVVSILPRMKTKNASAVLQLMPAKRAARLSKRMITIAEK